MSDTSGETNPNPAPVPTSAPTQANPAALEPTPATQSPVPVPITVDEVRAELEALRSGFQKAQSPTGWRWFAQYLAPSLIAFLGVLVVTGISLYVQTRALNQTRETADKTLATERMKLLVSALPMIDQGQRDRILENTIRAIDPELALSLAADTEGTAHFRAQVYKAINVATPDEFDPERSSMPLTLDMSYRSAEPLTSSTGGRALVAVAGAYIPVGFLPKHMEGGTLSLVNFHGYPRETVVLARDPVTRLVVFACTNTDGLMPFSASPLPVPGTLVYMPSTKARSGNFVTEYLGSDPPYIRLKQVPDHIPSGTLVYGPEGAIGIVRDDQQVIEARIASDFASEEYQRSYDTGMTMMTTPPPYPPVQVRIRPK